MPSKANIIVVDDDPIIRKSLTAMLRHEGYTVSSAADGTEALDTLKSQEINLVLSDVSMPGMSGFTLLQEIKTFAPDIIVILITGYGTIENAVESIKHGAYDYITKPLLDEQVLLVIQRSLEQQRLRKENEKLKQQVHRFQKTNALNVLGHNFKFKKTLELVQTVADSKATILLTGESGTGKTLMARTIHNLSHRQSQPFVEMSCGMLSETLLESELFGHAKGAFTGATHEKEGKFHIAHKGTIFLDEIAVASPALQLKMLRVLQDQTFEPVGSHTSTTVDVRVIAATNVDLEKEVREKRFRQDLFYRLNVISIPIPPLRERLSDVPLLAHYFLRKFNQQNTKTIEQISDAALLKLQSYPWPGNIRELENVIERAVVLCQDSAIHPVHLSISRPAHMTDIFMAQHESIASLDDALAGPERNIIKIALDRNNWNRQKTADLLGINRTTLFHKMKRHKLQKGSDD